MICPKKIKLSKSGMNHLIISAYSLIILYCSYTQNGLLHMLDRNRRLKLAPERFQNCQEQFEVLITCEERVYDSVVEFFESKGSAANIPVHIINIDITDNHDEAVKGAFIISDLVTQLAKSSDLDNEIDDIIAMVEEHTDKNFLHCIMFY